MASVPPSIAALPARTPALGALLERWCNINSGSGHAAGLTRMRETLRADFTQAFPAATITELVTDAPGFNPAGSRALSISQSTELGTVYRPGEIKGLGALAKEHGLAIHMDGARFFNALAGVGTAPADITWRAGVDVLCCGGTKLGMAVTEAVVFFNKELSQDFQYRCKQAGQLCSKMRFISAQWLRMLTDDTWKKHASSANALAKKLSDALGNLPGVQILYPVDANAVFAKLPDKMKAGLKERGWVFYSFIGGGTRLMCSWRTTEADVDAFVQDATAFA